MLRLMRGLKSLIAGSLLMVMLTPGATGGKDYAAARADMIKAVEAMARDTGRYTGRPVLDAAVMQALHKVPRHEFVPESMGDAAYLNRALPIGHDQTISQPYIVALMTDLAQVAPGDRVLEIGTGSGYQAAILAELGVEVYSIEIVRELGRRAADVLTELGYDNLHLRIGDGYQGWPEAAPFAAIIVTAAPPEIPQALVDQLAVGGRMVVPVGPQGTSQTLKVIEKQADGEISTREVIPVGFVPMVKPEDG